MEKTEAGQAPIDPYQAQEAKGTAALAQKYKDYENNKELVKDDNPYR